MRKLAEAGDVKAQQETGLAFRNGWGTEWNGAEAFKCFAIAFYASKHGANATQVAKVLQKFQGRYRVKGEGKNLVLGLPLEMTDEDFGVEKYISELAKQAVKVYQNIDKT
ncbi:MAG: hypothetical protein HDQ90_06810 [Desulfovibrio sp.]|nr:hypothetical protein [Desulfovibrio sp.]